MYLTRDMSCGRCPPRVLTLLLLLRAPDAHIAELFRSSLENITNKNIVKLIDIVNQNVYNMNTIERGDDLVATTPTQVRIDADIKNEATALFSRLGLDMSGAVNLFLHQCVLRGGLPFAVEIPKYSDKTLNAMAEARCISRDPDIKGYTSMEELKAALDD